jgi:hypothetical protein
MVNSSVIEYIRREVFKAIMDRINLMYFYRIIVNYIDFHYISIILENSFL